MPRRVSCRTGNQRFRSAEARPTQENATAFPGLIDALDRLRAHGVPVAVASFGRPQKIRFNLEQAGITEFFTKAAKRVVRVRRRTSREGLTYRPSRDPSA